MEPIRKLQKKKAAGLQPETALDTASNKANHTSIPKKWERVLKAFVSGRSFNRFEAERILNDHCLHTTVSTIQDMGVTIDREFETVPGYMSIPTRVRRYWLNRNEVNHMKALSLLPKSQQQGGL